MSDEPLQKAIDAAGGPVALSRHLGISSQAVAQWRQAPPARVIEIEKLTGISRHDLRPDIFGPAKQDEAA